MLRKIPKERISHLHRGGSLEVPNGVLTFVHNGENIFSGCKDCSYQGTERREK
jgi:hypothetical protein